MHSKDPLSLETIAKLQQQAKEASNQGNLEEALRILDEAEELAHTMADPLAMGLVWRGRAHVWQVNSDYEASLQAVNQAVAIYEAHGTAADVARARVSAVFKLGVLGRFDEAFAIAEWVRPHFKGDPFFQAILAASLAPVYTWSSQYEKAIETYQQAWELYTELDMPLQAAYILHNMGVAARQMDNLQAARDYFMRAYPQYVAANSAVDMVKIKYNLAKLCMRQNQLQEAMTHLAQARTDAERLPPDSPNIAYIDVYEARVQWALNQPQIAEPLFRRALATFEEAEWLLDVVETLIELGHLLAESVTPEKQAEGLTCLEKAAARLESLQIPLLAASVCLSRAELLLRFKRNDEAMVQAQEAQKLFAGVGLHLRAAQARIVWADSCRQQQPDHARLHYETALQTVAETIPLAAARCWRGLGQLARAAGDSQTAEEAIAQAINILDKVRRSLSGHRHQASFFEDKQIVTTELLATLHDRPRQAEKILTWVERFKAGALADLLARQPVEHHVGTALHTLSAEREALSAALDRRWSDLTIQSRGPAIELSQRSAALARHDLYQAEEAAALSRRLQAVDAQIALSESDAYAWREGVAIDSHTIHTLIDEKTVLVSYYAIGNQLYALTATHEEGDSHIHRLPITQDMGAKQWQQLRRRLLRPDGSAKSVQERLGQLWQGLIAPLAHRLEDKNRLLILPHRHLFYIPFAGLYNPQQQRFLIEEWMVQLVPSATILGHCQRRTAGTGPPLLIGYAGAPRQPGYLEGVRPEIENLARLWPQATVLLHEAATLPALLQMASGRAIIHLAGHIHYDGTDPLASGMPLADGRWLRASDLYLRYGQLSGATIVLSGCESARVGLAGGDVLGLTSAFLYAGATSLVAGLWPVDDAATAVLMQAFYRALAQGLDVAAALQAAQVQLLRQEPYSHPYYWAPFIVNGASPRLG